MFRSPFGFWNTRNLSQFHSHLQIKNRKVKGKSSFYYSKRVFG
ncbi:hypothetical protein WN944_015578 [Citrus x changshan-huyou]|uniref:Uncharacterized protein n=1 Tax=Citrus x changshan-huyou TaxID=2935761 RepID=A0AAP0MC43_9ROSI